MKKWFLSLIILFTTLTGSYAQYSGLYNYDKKYEDDPYDDLTFFSIGLNYLSDNVYHGRRDSVTLPYINPYIGYHLHCGIYGKATVSYAPTRKNGHFDLLTLELGYDRNFGTSVLAGVYSEKYFYYKRSPGIRAAIKESGSIYCQYKNDLVEPQVSFTINHGNAMDIVAGTTFDHDFHIKDNQLNIIPAITVNVGSQNYYNQYFIDRAFQKDHIVIPYQVVNNAGGIKALDLEFSAKTTYRTGGWFFTVIPLYSIPLSAAKITLPNRVVQEILKNTFSIELDVCYRQERK